MGKKEIIPNHTCPLADLAKKYGVRFKYLADGNCWALDAQNVRSCCSESTHALVAKAVPQGEIVAAVQVSVQNDKKLEPKKRGYNPVRQSVILERLQRKI